jgi:hypothetical protein
MRALTARAMPYTLLVATVLAGSGCRRPVPQPSADAEPALALAAPEPSSTESTAAPPPDGGPYAGPWIEALSVQVQVLSDTEFLMDKKRDRDRERERGRDPKVVRLGYLRYGEKVPALAGDPQKKPNCPEGWYSLLAGGFVCGRFVTSDLQHPKLRTIHPPDLDGPLPYTYGVNLFNGTPLYRQLPSHAQRRNLEPWLYRPRKPKNVDTSGSTDSNPYSTASTSGPVDAGTNYTDTDQSDTPWWEKEAPTDGGPLQITLEELQENEGPIARRMVKGFYLSLDHELEAGGWKWWRTVDGLSAPAEHILIQKPVTDYHGVWLGRDDATFETKNHPARRIDKLPVAFVMAYHGRRWALDESQKHASAMPSIGKRTKGFGCASMISRERSPDRPPKSSANKKSGSM